MLKKTLIFFSSMLFIVSVCFGQTAQTGALNGTVTDPDGGALPGITIILKSPALVLPQITTVTNAKGQYRFLGLAPGTYEVTFMLEGMNTLVRKGIIVKVGQTSTVDVGMTLKSVEESIIVSGKAPTVDRQSTTGVASLDLEFLKSIPTANRSYNDYFNLTPGVTGDTAHGSSEMDNAYLLDGVNMGDPTTGTDYVSFGADIMEEISVQTGGISAEYGSVKGAVVNVVTKSGGNKFSGSASFYYNHESLQSDNTKGTDLYDPEDTTKTGQKFKMEPVVTFGGPLVKDKLWFFGNLSMTSQEEYEPGYPHDEEQDIPSDMKQYYPYIKFTFQPNTANKFILSYNYSDRRMNHRFAHWSRNVENTVTQASPTHVFNAHWTKTFGSNFYVNLKAAMIDYEMLLHAKQPGTEFWNRDTNINTGSYWRNEDNNIRDRYQVNLDATTFIDDFAGSHELKFGGEMQLAKTQWEVVTNDGPGLDGGFGYITVIPGNWYYWGYNFNGGFNRQEEMLNYSFFVNDIWSLTKNLTITLGLRYDYQSIIWPAQSLDRVGIWNPRGEPIDMSIPEKSTPMKWNNITPRLGLIYDIFSDGTTLFKASYGRYVQPNQVGWINLAHPAGWFMWRVPLDPDTLEPLPYTPQILWAPGGSIGIGYNGHDLTAPYSDEITIGVERELWEDWSLGVRYIKKWDKNLIEDVDAAHLNIDTLFNTGELEWIDYAPVDLIDPYSGNTYTFYNDMNFGRVPEPYIINPPGAERGYDGVELTLDKRYSRGWAANLSYVYARSRGLIDTQRGNESLGTSGLYENPNYHTNRDGRFFLERRHQFKVTGLVKGPWGINVSGYFRYMSGRRRTRQISSDYVVNYDPLNQANTTINAEARGATSQPEIVLLDLRLEKAFKLGNVRFSVFADIFNIFNTNTTTSYTTNNSSHPTLDWQETDEIVDPRVVRLGAKLEFN